jgi:CheY-like chemotaxis protein
MQDMKKLTSNMARKQAEKALLQAGSLQIAIFNSANFSSIATDAKGVIQMFNVGAERMLGYMADEVMNKITPADISDPQEVIARAEALSAELGTTITPGFEALVFKASRGIEDIYELTYIRKDGSRFPAVVSVTALRDEQDIIIGYLLIGTDNTARKQIEAEQKQLGQRLRDHQFYTRSLFESNIDALMTTDPSGIITDVNKQMEALTDCTRDELIGAPFKKYFTDPERAEASIKLVLSEKKVTFTKRATILVVDDMPENLALMNSLLKDYYKVKIANGGEKALKIAASDSPPDLILLDIMMPGMDGYEVCRRLKSDPKTMNIPIIFLTARSDAEDEKRGLELGAADYITKPISSSIVMARVKNHLALKAMADFMRDQNTFLELEVEKRTTELVVAKEEAEKGKLKAETALFEIRELKDQLEAERAYLQEEIKLEYNHDKIIGQSDGLKYVLYKVEQIAGSDTTVLVLGETGTGKELVARAIHGLSLRKNRALVKVNCAALPSNLIESELFGHEKGAFTGSHSRRLGRFEVANGATLFLDEIGELPLELQSNLALPLAGVKVPPMLNSSKFS